MTDDLDQLLKLLRLKGMSEILALLTGRRPVFASLADGPHGLAMNSVRPALHVVMLN